MFENSSCRFLLSTKSVAVQGFKEGGREGTTYKINMGKLVQTHLAKNVAPQTVIMLIRGVYNKIVR